MKLPIPPEKAKLIARLPREDRKPIAEIAAVQTFKLMAWATATAGIYLLQHHNNSWGLRFIPYLLWMMIVWDLTDKFHWEPPIERKDGQAFALLTRGYFLRLACICAVCWFLAWAVVFWLSPLVYQHVLAPKLGGA